MNAEAITAKTIAALLQQALAQHQRGQYSAAEALYQQVLDAQPQHFDALHLLGVLARQRGRAQLAVGLITQALQIDPGQAAAHCNLGASWQDLNQPERALYHYEQALALNPGYALALNNRGNALRKLQRSQEALRSYGLALECQPQYPEAHYNRATVLHVLEHYDAARKGFEHALQQRPNYPDAWCNHGLALQMMQCYEQALVSYEQALRYSAHHAASWCNRGTALRKLDRLTEALHSYDKALETAPDFADAHLFRGNVLRLLGRADEAVASYRRAQACGADSGQVRFLLASLGAGAVPHASPADYVRELFDDYAGHFDQHLRGVLNYRTPELLVSALHKSGFAKLGDIIDLGCGTGLCGPLLKPFARSLTGIDLSPRMLEKAQLTGVYDQLLCADIVTFLQEEVACYDLAVATDVLVYLGDLAPLFNALRLALREHGAFAFSVESHAGDGFVLRPSQRYAHAADYLRKAASDYGFSIVAMEQQVLRYDVGAAIDGYLVIANRNGQ